MRPLIRNLRYALIKKLACGDLILLNANCIDCTIEATTPTERGFVADNKFTLSHRDLFGRIQPKAN